jgi:hypothetical protein
MKLGRTMRYKLRISNGNEEWKVRSKTILSNYWKTYNCDNWIYITPNLTTEKHLLDLNCSFQIMEKYGKYETYKVRPNEDVIAAEYAIENKVEKIISKIIRLKEINWQVICNQVDKVEEFIKWRNERNKNDAIKIINTNNLKLMRCSIIVGIKKEGEEKETRFLQELNSKFKELNLEIERLIWNYGICLDTTIVYWLTEREVLLDETTNTIYHEIFPRTGPDELMYETCSKRAKKKIRLIKTGKN